MKIKGKIKAAYIFSIISFRCKSHILQELSSEEKIYLESSLSQIDMLSNSKKKLILDDFIKNIQYIRNQSKRQIIQAFYFSFSIFAVLILASAIYAAIKTYSTSKTLIFIESIIMYGGSHIVILPLIFNLIKKKNKSIIKLFISKNILTDFIFAGLAALTITLLFVLNIQQVKTDISESYTILALLIAISIGPLVEELFFRFYLFYTNGKKYGYIITGSFSSLLFSLVHLPDTFTFFCLYIASGIILCTLYYYRKNILAPFIAHAIANFLILML